MPKIQTLKERGTDVTLYPETTAEAVYFSDGSNAEQKIAGLNEGISAKESAFTLSDDLQMSEERELSVTEKAKRKLFIDMWNEACGTAGQYNAATGYFELNGLTDITYEQAITIYNVGKGDIAYLTDRFSALNIRTHLPLIANGYGDTGVLIRTFAYSKKIETVQISGLIVGPYAFMECEKLKCVNTIAYRATNLNHVNTDTVFRKCYALEEIRGIISENFNISFVDSPKLSLSSFQYMVSNAHNTSAIAITVHPDVYAKLTGDTTKDAYNNLTDDEKAQWTGLVASAAEKNITFATT